MKIRNSVLNFLYNSGTGALQGAFWTVEYFVAINYLVPLIYLSNYEPVVS